MQDEIKLDLVIPGAISANRLHQALQHGKANGVPMGKVADKMGMSQANLFLLHRGSVKSIKLDYVQIIEQMTGMAIMPDDLLKEFCDQDRSTLHQDVDRDDLKDQENPSSSDSVPAPCDLFNPLEALRTFILLWSESRPVHAMVRAALARHGYSMDAEGIEFFIENSSAVKDERKEVIRRYLGNLPVAHQAMQITYPCIATAIGRLTGQSINGHALEWLDSSMQLESSTNRLAPTDYSVTQF